MYFKTLHGLAIRELQLRSESRAPPAACVAANPAIRLDLDLILVKAGLRLENEEREREGSRTCKRQTGEEERERQLREF